MQANILEYSANRQRLLVVIAKWQTPQLCLEAPGSSQWVFDANRQRSLFTSALKIYLRENQWVG